MGHRSRFLCSSGGRARGPVPQFSAQARESADLFDQRGAMLRAPIDKHNIARVFASVALTVPCCYLRRAEIMPLDVGGVLADSGGCPAAGAATAGPKPQSEPVEIVGDDRRRIESQRLADDQAADDRDAKRRDAQRQ